MKCDELNAETIVPQGSAVTLQMYGKAEVDEAIAELKDKVQQKDFFWEGCAFGKRGFKNTIEVSEYVDTMENLNDELQKENKDIKDKLRHYPMMAAIIEADKKENAEHKARIAQLEDDNALLRKNNAELRSKNEGLLYALADAETDLAMATRWRKFSEEKPDDKQWILVHVENPSKYGTYIELRRWDMVCKFDVENQELYTKWMPLPKAPEVK